MENIDMSVEDIFTWQKKCSNSENINLQSHIIANKAEIYWSKLNNWGNTKFSSCIGLEFIQISHGIQASAKHSYNKGNYPQEEKTWFVTGVYDYFSIKRDILQLTI